MKTLSISILLLALAGCGTSTAFKVSALVSTVANGIDAQSTISSGHRCPSCKESTLVFGPLIDRGPRTGRTVMLSIAVAQLYTSYRIEKKARGTGTLFNYMFAAGHSVGAYNNSRIKGDH